MIGGRTRANGSRLRFRASWTSPGDSAALAFLLIRSTILVCPVNRIARSRRSTRQALAEFQAGIRRRYTDAQILDELRASAERLGRSPTMKEFAADAQSQVHPQTVIEHFGTWNAAKRAAG